MREMSPGREQPDRFVGTETGTETGAVRRFWGQVKGRHPPDGLAPYPQRLAAGGDDPQPGAPGQQELDEGGAVADLMLAGIEDEKHVPRAQRLG